MIMNRLGSFPTPMRPSAPVQMGGEGVMRPPTGVRRMMSYKKGGKVKKTGPAWLHKGEKVIPLSKLRSK